MRTSIPLIRITYFGCLIVPEKGSNCLPNREPLALLSKALVGLGVLLAGEGIGITLDEGQILGLSDLIALKRLHFVEDDGGDGCGCG